MLFLSLVHKQKKKIAEAARIANIGYENAKVINRVYKQQGRLLKLERKNPETKCKVRINTLGRSAVISGISSHGVPKRLPFILIRKPQDKDDLDIRLPSILLTENKTIQKNPEPYKPLKI